MAMSLQTRLHGALQPWLSAPRWQVAYSGGLDSTVLLHLLVELGRSVQLPPVVAIHVDHGLQPAATFWPAHCERFCAQLGIPFEQVRVQVSVGASLENHAREARYGALAARLTENAVLLTAQHRDDQAETLLFRLLRGAGVLGLAGMRGERRFGSGWLVRPLLDCGRSELERYAHERQLQWIEDPSNQSLAHARNYLRHQVLPALQARWPQASARIASTARHCREAQQLLDELADLDLATASTTSRHAWLPLPSLDLQVIRALSPARQRNLLRRWLGRFTALPDSEHWAGWDALRDAAVDAAPVWRLAGGELRRGDGRLWWLAGPWLDGPAGGCHSLSSKGALSLPGNGEVRVAGPQDTQGLEVRYRDGGERLELPVRGRRDLKRLLNEAGVPGFVRPRLPLLYRDGQLTAVANLPQYDTGHLSLAWAPPPIPGLS